MRLSYLKDECNIDTSKLFIASLNSFYRVSNNGLGIYYYPENVNDFNMYCPAPASESIVYDTNSRMNQPNTQINNPCYCYPPEHNNGPVLDNNGSSVHYENPQENYFYNQQVTYPSRSFCGYINDNNSNYNYSDSSSSPPTLPDLVPVMSALNSQVEDFNSMPLDTNYPYQNARPSTEAPYLRRNAVNSPNQFSSSQPGTNYMNPSSFNAWTNDPMSNSFCNCVCPCHRNFSLAQNRPNNNSIGSNQHRCTRQARRQLASDQYNTFEEQLKPIANLNQVKLLVSNENPLGYIFPKMGGLTQPNRILLSATREDSGSSYLKSHNKHNNACQQKYLGNNDSDLEDYLEDSFKEALSPECADTIEPFEYRKVRSTANDKEVSDFKMLNHQDQFKPNLEDKIYFRNTDKQETRHIPFVKDLSMKTDEDCNLSESVKVENKCLANSKTSNMEDSAMLREDECKIYASLKANESCSGICKSSPVKNSLNMPPPETPPLRKKKIFQTNTVSESEKIPRSKDTCITEKQAVPSDFHNVFVRANEEKGASFIKYCRFLRNKDKERDNSVKRKAIVRGRYNVNTNDKYYDRLYTIENVIRRQPLCNKAKRRPWRRSLATDTSNRHKFRTNARRLYRVITNGVNALVCPSIGIKRKNRHKAAPKSPSNTDESYQTGSSQAIAAIELSNRSIPTFPIVTNASAAPLTREIKQVDADYTRNKDVVSSDNKITGTLSKTLVKDAIEPLLKFNEIRKMSEELDHTQSKSLSVIPGSTHSLQLSSLQAARDHDSSNGSLLSQRTSSISGSNLSLSGRLRRETPNNKRPSISLRPKYLSPHIYYSLADRLPDNIDVEILTKNGRHSLTLPHLIMEDDVEIKKDKIEESKEEDVLVNRPTPRLLASKKYDAQFLDMVETIAHALDDTMERVYTVEGYARLQLTSAFANNIDPDELEKTLKNQEHSVRTNPYTSSAARCYGNEATDNQNTQASTPSQIEKKEETLTESSVSVENRLVPKVQPKFSTEPERQELEIRPLDVRVIAPNMQHYRYANMSQDELEHRMRNAWNYR